MFQFYLYIYLKLCANDVSTRAATRFPAGGLGFSQCLTGYFMYGAAFRRPFSERRLLARRPHTLAPCTTPVTHDTPTRVRTVIPTYNFSSVLSKVRTESSPRVPQWVFSSVSTSANRDSYRSDEHGLDQRIHINALFMDVFLTGVCFKYYVCLFLMSVTNYGG